MAAKPENWFEVHNNSENQAKHTRKYHDLKVGDKVKVFKERGVLPQEVFGDYNYDAIVITGTAKSLGLTLFSCKGRARHSGDPIFF